MDIKQVFPPQPVSSMNEQQQLLAAIILNPDEDTPRGMYADWLMEYGDSLDNKLGEYIKLSLELHNHKRNALVRKDDKIKGVEIGSGKGNDINGYDWYKRGIKLRDSLDEAWRLSKAHTCYDSIPDFSQIEQDRGFISSITCTATQFLAVCDKLIWHPSMVDECPNPDGWSLYGKHIVSRNRKKYSGGSGVLCPTCSGKRVIPRPCPLTAHPIREVTVTNTGNNPLNSMVQKIDEWKELAPKYGIKLKVLL